MRWYRNNNSIITLSDEELNKKFAWKRKCFKNPFFGFEDELELREFKVLLDSYIYGKVEDQIESPVVESDFKNVDLFFFFNLKHKLYEASVRRILMRDIKEYQLSFLTKKSLKRAMDANIFIKMYSLAVKKQKQKSDLYIADNINTLAKFDKTNMIDSYFSTGELSIDDLLKDESTLEYFENFISPVKFLNENFGFNDVFEEHVETDKKKHIFLSKEYSFWNLNKKIVSEIKQTLEEPLEEIISFIFEDSQVKILKDSDIRNMVFWSERNIPFFFLNRNTGMVDYDFWNNTEERIECRKIALKLWLKGVFSWKEVEAQNLSMSRTSLRGFFGFQDIVLRSNVNHPTKIEQHNILPSFSKIYELFLNPSKASLYPRILYGLVGPTLAPHWCLLFTITKKRKNIYFTVSDVAGKVLLTVSAGKYNIHRRKRFSPHALEPMYQSVLNCFKKLKIKNVILIVKFKAKYMYMHTYNFFKKNRINVKLIIEKLPVPHNGIRARKQKRL